MEQNTDLYFLASKPSTGSCPLLRFKTTFPFHLSFLAHLFVTIAVSTATVPAYSTQYRGILPFASVTYRCADSAVYPVRTSGRLSFRIGK